MDLNGKCQTQTISPKKWRSSGRLEGPGVPSKVITTLTEVSPRIRIVTLFLVTELHDPLSKQFKTTLGLWPCSRKAGSGLRSADFEWLL